MENPSLFPLKITTLVILIPTILLFLHFIIHAKKSRKNTQNKKLPQPKGAWPVVGHLHLLGGKTTIHRTLGAMANQHGPIFSLKLGQKRAIVLNSMETVKKFFSKLDSITSTRPQLALSKHLAYDYAAFTNSPYGKYWRDIRKISTVELLSPKRLEKLKHVRAFEIKCCISNLYNECCKFKTCRITLCKWIKYTSFNIAMRMIVGKRYSPEMYDEKSTFAARFMDLIGRATYVAGIAVPSDFVACIEWLDLNGYIRSMKEIHKDIDMIIGHWLDEHIKKREDDGGGVEDGDFMDVMLSNIAENCVMSGYSRDTIIKATALTLLLTGSESTSITLTWAISLLLNHPKHLKKAQEELDHQIGKQKWVQESDINQLPYLQAIVKETLRLYPPSPLMGPREAMEDCSLDDVYFIPKGTRIIVNIWKVHRDPSVWVRPNDFWPERFLKEHENINFKAQSFEYLPFSLGRRGCPGMDFGLQVVHLMLAYLIQGFDIWTEDGKQVDMEEDLGLALPKADPLNVLIAPRLPIMLYEILFLK